MSSMYGLMIWNWCTTVITICYKFYKIATGKNKMYTHVYETVFEFLKFFRSFRYLLNYLIFSGAKSVD